MSTGFALSRLNQLFVAVLIPLGDPTAWKSVSFRSITPNRVEHKKNELNIHVQKSASPLVHRLASPLVVEKLNLALSFDGTLRADSSSSFEEDSRFRLGLVLEGRQRLSFWQRSLAADWVLRLFELAPPQTGLDQIHFLMIGHQQSQFGKKRKHPKSDLLFEEIVATKSEEKVESFRLELPFQRTSRVLALWVSVDGDDTKSNFVTRVQQIELVGQNP